MYLRGSGVAAQLAYRLDDVVHPPHMALRQQPSVRVGRTRAAEPEAAVAYELPGLTARAQTERFELQQDHVREAVVDLEEIHVGR